MQQEQGEPGRLTYCADTSALFDLKEHWQMGVFPSLWTRIDRIVAEGRLFAPQAVLEEIRRGDDDWSPGPLAVQACSVLCRRRCCLRLRRFSPVFPTLSIQQNGTRMLTRTSWHKRCSKGSLRETCFRHRRSAPF